MHRAAGYPDGAAGRHDPQPTFHLATECAALHEGKQLSRGTVKTITAHYIDGAFVESHGPEVMDIIKPTNGQVIARVTLADEEDMGATIRAVDSSHVPMLSHPDIVVDVIRAAAKAVEGSSATA
jgi:hypothetical protein